MKNSILILCKVQITELFKLNQLTLKGNEKSKRHFWLSSFGMVALGLILMTYAYMIGLGFSQIGLGELLPAYGLIISSFCTLFFTVLKANGILFGYKDYEMVMSLPVKTSAIISSRFIMMYLMNLIVAMLIMVPMGVAFVQFQGVKPSFYFFWLAGILISPLVPTTIASVIGALITWIASKFRHTNILVSVLSILMLIGVLVLSLSLGKVDENQLSTDSIAGMGKMLGDSINQLYPFAALFTKAVLKGDIFSLLLFAGISIVWYLIFLSLLSMKYKEINTAILTHRTHSDYKLKVLKTEAPIMALYKKELKRFLTCNVYLINIGCGIIMLLVVSVASLFVTSQTIESILPATFGMGRIVSMMPFAICGLLGMTCTTCVALSLEGKNIWILKSLPIQGKIIFQSKILVNLTITVPAAIVSAVLISIRFATSLLQVISMFIIPLIFCLFTAIWGMFIDIKMCKYDWVSETSIVKQSANSMIGMLGNPIIGFVPIAVLMLVPNLNPLAVTIIAGVVALSLAGILYHKVCTADLP